MTRLEDAVISFDDEPADYVATNPRVFVSRWWVELDPGERVLYRGLVALSIGLAAIYWPLALIVPGFVITGLAVVTYILGVWRSERG